MIALGSDHAGFELKQAIIKHLEERNIEYKDYGPYSADSVDYAVYAEKTAKGVVSGECGLGILICGTGVGMSLVANKHKGIRAACCSDTFSARLTRVHNDANVLCFGERVVGMGLAFDLVDNFLGAEYEGGKHARRVGMIDAIENGTFEE